MAFHVPTLSQQESFVKNTKDPFQPLRVGVEFDDGVTYLGTAVRKSEKGKPFQRSFKITYDDGNEEAVTLPSDDVDVLHLIELTTQEPALSKENSLQSTQGDKHEKGDEQWKVGDDVLAFWGKTLFDARIVDIVETKKPRTRLKKGETFVLLFEAISSALSRIPSFSYFQIQVEYKVHFAGWNDRHDRWLGYIIKSIVSSSKQICSN